MGYLQGDWIPHPNSLLFNAFPPFWALKAFWFTRKTGQLMMLWDFPAVPEGHPDNERPRKYFSFKLH